MARQKLNPNQMPLFETPSDWRTPTELPLEILHAQTISLDTETCDPGLREKGPSWFRGGGKVVGISLGWADKSIYLPFGHEGGDNMPKDIVISFVKDLLKNFKGTLVFMHALYDLGWLRTEGIFVNHEAEIRDVMMLEALLDEHKQRYNLDSLAVTYGLEKKDERLLKEAAANYGFDAKSEMWRLGARFVGAYASYDAGLTLAVYHRQMIQIQLQNLERVVELEHDLLPLLLEMRWRGVKVDVNKAEELYDQFTKQEKEFTKEIQRLTNRPIDIWSADSCAAACDAVNLSYRQTASGKHSFEDDWLASHQHEVPQLISKARKQYKAANSFCKGMVLDHVDRNGYVHASFNQLKSDDGGTVSGRFSSSQPNLQQVPGEKNPEMNNLIRGLFLPEDGEMWCAADYSQQEPRLTVHYASVNNCRAADEAVRRYNEDAATDYHQMVADFADIERKPAKTINLGLAYGMGGAKLARKLGLPTIMKENRYSGRTYEAAGPEAQAILDKYHGAVPFIKQLQDLYSGQANREGFIPTLSGRRCRFPFYEPKNGGRAMLYKEAGAQHGFENIKRAFTHAALNRKIQGGSADMIKIALRNLWREGFVPKVTVHDENGFSVPSRKEALQVAEIMCDCVKLRVPLKVDVDVGPSWGVAKPLVDEDE